MNDVSAGRSSAPPRLVGVGRVHFVGIGGAGMSAIAKVLLEQGVTVSGSDLKPSRAARMLQALGADVHLGHDPDLVDGAGTVVFSAAIPSSNAELRRARDLGIACVSRGEALAAVLADRRAVVVAGTHGKTTTTSMIVSIFDRAGTDPTYLVGGGLNDAGTNARWGSGRYAIAESDESDGSFLLLEPDIAVVTNVEADHLDHWGSFAAIKQGFARFALRVRPGGTLILPVTEPDLEVGAGVEVVRFGAGGDVEADAPAPTPRGSTFSIRYAGDGATVDLQVPGRHNVDNALAAAAAALSCGLTLDQVVVGLNAFAGVERRFQVRGSVAGATVVDDYAHHPTEIAATLAAARATVGDRGRIVAVFQPHRYSRTAAFARDFGAAFRDADAVVVTDIYGAGEEPVPGITGKLVADEVCRRLPRRAVAYLPHRDELLAYLTRTMRHGDVVFTLGAGDITTLGEDLLARLASR